jgi:HEAT repeat protein/Fe-S cluster biosynthesis and repair protein YggX
LRSEFTRPLGCLVIGGTLTLLVVQFGRPADEMPAVIVPADWKTTPATGADGQEIQLAQFAGKGAKEPETLSALIVNYVAKVRFFDKNSKADYARYQDMRTQLVSEMKLALRNAKDRAAFYAATMMITDLADKEYDKIGDKLINSVFEELERPEKVSRRLTDDLVAEANPAKDWHVRYVSLRTLGKITPNPDKVFGVIRDNLNAPDGSDANAEPARQVAAYTLVDLARYAHLLPRSPGNNAIPQEQLKTLAQVASSAAIGAQANDDLVRGYSLLAVIEAAHSLNSTILPQQKAADTIIGVGKGPPRELENILNLAEFRPDFQQVFQNFQAINPALLKNLDGTSEKITYTALEAIENIATSRNNFVHYLRVETGNVKDDAAAILKNVPVKDPGKKTVVVADPLEGIIADRGEAIARLLESPAPPGTPPESGVTRARIRRKAMEVLNNLSRNWRLLEPDAKNSLLERLSCILRDEREDIFVRWSAINLIDAAIKNELDSPGAADALNVIEARGIDDGLINIFAARKDSSYVDPDVSRAAAAALESLGNLARTTMNVSPQKARLMDRYAALLKNLFIAEQQGVVFYDRGIRYDVEMRQAVIRALVSLGGNFGPETVDVLAEALAKDRDARIRRSAAEALGKIGPAAEKAIPTLLEALRLDDDAEVRVNASETILLLKGRQ